MSRVSFTDPGTGALAWFDPDAARDAISEGRTWTGENWIGACSGLQTSQSVLYLTKGGRWIENRDARGEYNGSDEYRYFTDEQARTWLVKAADARRDSEAAQAALKRHFPDTPDGTDPDPKGGRPAVGPTINVAFPRPLLDKIEVAAKADGLSRAAWLRKIAEGAVS